MLRFCCLCRSTRFKYIRGCNVSFYKTKILPKRFHFSLEPFNVSWKNEPTNLLNKLLFQPKRYASNEPKYTGNRFSKRLSYGLVILCGLSLVCGFVIGFSIVKNGTPVISYERFFYLLERGEIERVNITPGGDVAYVDLRNAPPYAKSVRMVLSVTKEVFENDVRVKEQTWGIPYDDKLQINQHFVSNVAENQLINWVMSISLITICALIISGLFVMTKMSRTGAKGEKVMSALDFEQEIIRSRGRPGRTAKESKQESKNGDEAIPVDSRSNRAMPFSWDPLAGFNTIKPVTTDIKFKDIAGLHASKEEVIEFVSYLKDSTKYRNLGAKLPKGALLLGPPGVGKTLLVKALANESGVPFYSMAGSEFVEIIGGLGAYRMRQLFQAARAKQPSIVFIDELDSVGRRRSSDNSAGGKRFAGGNGSSEMEQTLNQLLVEMDGMDTSENVIVFGATNRADLLDKALLRAGRFDRHISIDLPNLCERKELFTMYIGKYRLASDVLTFDLVDRLAEWTPGMSGADIAQLCNQAALIAARRENYLQGVTKPDFVAALERVLSGVAKQSNPLSPHERYIAAVHESGRALIAWLIPRTGLLPVKISIIPRTLMDPKNSTGLGFTQLIAEEKAIFNNEELADRMAVLLSGRAAEHILFSAVSDASKQNLRQAYKLAMKQVREFGMSKLIGNLSFQSDNEFSVKPFSQKTQLSMELEAQRLVNSAFDRSVSLLQENKEKLQNLIDALMKKEVLSYSELVEMLGGEYNSKIKPNL